MTLENTLDRAAGHPGPGRPPLRTADRLRLLLGDRAVLAGHADYDRMRTPWNLAIDQRPFAVVQPESAEEVVDAVRAAAACGLRVAAQSTGHAAAALADTDLSTTLLVSLARLRGVTVDAERRTARVLGGTVWNDVLEAAAPYGLTALHGSAGDVSVAGYSLSGGVSFYARRHGLAVGAVRAAQMVTADGTLVRASAEENPDLFWAVRGGSGAFGVVVSLEIDLLPYPDVYAGMLMWDAARAADVAHAWARWTATAPESATTALRILHFPPLPELPPFLAGRSLVVIDGAILATDEAASDLLQPLRDLAPEMDTFARIPAAGLVQVHMDPPGPTPALTGHAMLAGLPAEAVDAFVASAATPGLFIAELRHVGAAAALRPEGGGAVAALEGDYLAHTVAMVPAPEAAAGAVAATSAGIAALSPWHADALALTFVDGGGANRAPGFGASLPRLRELKHAYDPEDRFAAGQPL
ncbi:FAD-binding oxidoreductase [Microbacterium hominis]|uniref:FAD-binding oxidoreductase n=1 Tax=Microbacterium hominis TaxID=162426 RepID=A0A7D4PL95_9MICO|nr:FAD-binding oxidoreductase [Microbacterium hominis]QKJ18735.1 FAD-binding oxidoreductase [Microbacterium hominis]